MSLNGLGGATTPLLLLLLYQIRKRFGTYCYSISPENANEIVRYKAGNYKSTKSDFRYGHE